jgi:hypothetical protein
MFTTDRGTNVVLKRGKRIELTAPSNKESFQNATIFRSQSISRLNATHLVDQVQKEKRNPNNLAWFKPKQICNGLSKTQIDRPVCSLIYGG